VTYSLAIHDRPGSFSDRWAERAAELGVEHELVDCLGTRIIADLRRHDALLWHWTHTDPADLLVARSIIRSAEELGLLVFPSTATCWSFDDKIAQKYQLEALGLPLAQTDCFYSEEAALAWIDRADFPRVMKLRGGAGSTNVRLVRSRREARRMARQAFGSGFSTGSMGAGALPSDASLRLARAKARRDLAGVLLRLPRTLYGHWRTRRPNAERDYLYMQEFLPNNRYDTRVTVVGRRAFAFTRNVRKNDFRASGSGDIDYSRDRVAPECLRIAFEASRKLRSQSAAFDFAFDAEGKPKVLEWSFGYLAKAIRACPGYWDEDLKFVEGQCWPQDAILDDLLAALRERAGDRPAAAPGERSGAA
jgi:glutathione synthase/RimK-type ligase-like ATP-grasp enzyme